MRNRTACIVVDPNNGFLLDVNYTPQLAGGDMNLCIPGAIDGANRAADLIRRGAKLWDEIVVTLDSHQTMHIANPEPWIGKDGKPPRPFTQITLQDFDDGVWRPRLAGQAPRYRAYLEALYNKGKFAHIIWPPHCIIGTEGNLPYAPIREAIYDWEKDLGVVDWKVKGPNIWSEHFSALGAEVPDPNDESTKLDVRFVRNLETYDRIVIFGWALNFCLGETMRDLTNTFKDRSSCSKLVLVTDCTESVPGFEDKTTQILSEMKALGVQFENSRNVI